MVKINKPSNKNLLIGGLIALILVAAIIASFYYYNKYQQTQKLLTNPTEAAKKQVDNLVKNVGSLIILPANETPTVATVSDSNKLKGQSFFENAQNGDKVLIYTKAGKAILYRPSTNKIINVGPVNLNQNSAKPTAPANVNVALFNGSTVTGLTSKIEDKLMAKFSNISVVDKSNASKSDYEKTIVVDLAGKQNAIAGNIADYLGGTVGKLPDGEKAPSGADILVILGKQ